MDAAATGSGRIGLPAAGGGKRLGGSGSEANAAGVEAAAGVSKEYRRQRRPLGQVVNGTTSGGAGSRGALNGRAGSTR